MEIASSRFLSRSFAWLVLGMAAAGIGASCSASPEPEVEELENVDGPEPTGDRGDPVGSGTVAQAVSGSCATSSVKGLSEQIIAEGNCIVPGAYEKVPSQPNLTVSANVFTYLEKPARDALVSALQSQPGKTMQVNSMLRTVAQQYLLYRWYQTGTCGIGLAAKPGASNHETGLAFDIASNATWQSTLQAKGFTWLGSKDPPHFDYSGSGAVSHKGVDVKAFQRLWNRNNPQDKISEDGAWGPQTEERMKKSPAAGFPIGAECGDSSGSSGGTGGDPPAACAHAACEVGVKLDAACDPCVAQICAADAFCCDNSWDATCTGEVASVCGHACDGSPAPSCGAYAGSAAFKCAPDGLGRGKCVNDALVFEGCANGCLIKNNADDVCMGTSASWACSGSYGTAKMDDGNYYATSFGCWVDGNGDPHSDPGDNCIPGCLNQAQNAGLCAGMSGPACEQSVNWFAADAGRYGCLARLRVTNPANGKSVVVVALDYGPACWVEDQVDDGVLDLSYPSTNYLFGDQVGVLEKKGVHVVEVDPSTPLGPQ
jgi:hypothetical protein